MMAIRKTSRKVPVVCATEGIPVPQPATYEEDSKLVFANENLSRQLVDACAELEEANTKIARLEDGLQAARAEIAVLSAEKATLQLSQNTNDYKIIIGRLHDRIDVLLAQNDKLSAIAHNVPAITPIEVPPPRHDHDVTKDYFRKYGR